MNTAGRKAMIAASKPHLCACQSYPWLHRAGFGWCKTESHKGRSEQIWAHKLNQILQHIARMRQGVRV